AGAEGLLGRLRVRRRRLKTEKRWGAPSSPTFWFRSDFLSGCHPGAALADRDRLELRWAAHRVDGEELGRRAVALAVESDVAGDSVGDGDRVDGGVEALGVGLAPVGLQGRGERHHSVVLVRRVVAWILSVLRLVRTRELVVLGVVDELGGRQSVDGDAGVRHG